MPNDLVEFLRACLDDEHRDAEGKHDQYACDLSALLTFGDCSCGYPDKVRAEVDAARRIVELHKRFEGFVDCSSCGDVPQVPYPCKTLRLLALPRANQPGYQEEWRP